MTVAALYIRVSTEDQAREGTSLEVQREQLIRYAKEKRWEIYYPEKDRVYEDDGYSGGSMERPALKKLLADAKQKRFGIILVHKLDRFSRNIREMLNMVHELEQLDVSVHSATEFYNPGDSSGRMLFHQLMSYAEFERERIKERVFPGMVKSVQRGNWHGARYSPYGYRYDKDEKQWRFEDQ
jgi:site-specific DNA recombinase